METITQLLTSANVDSGKVALALVVMRVLGETFSSLKNGGGLIGLFRAVMYGANVPGPIAQDYKEELKPGGSKPPFPPANP